MDVSIIIVSYNTKKILQNCIKSIYQYVKRVKFEIIVVDNGSTDGSRTWLANQTKKKRLVLVDLKKNFGFGTANNRGAEKGRGEYYLFLNSDTLLKDNAIKDSLEWIKTKTEVGAMTCKLLNSDGSFQPTGGYFPTLGRVFNWQFFIDDLPFIGEKLKSIHPNEPGFLFINRLIRPSWQKVFKNWTANQASCYERLRYLDWITGAFMLMPKKIFNKVGGFDENIFMYLEELELCYRIKQLGRKIVYVPNFNIIHIGGASGGSALALSQEIKNLLYFYYKHYPHWQLLPLKIVLGTGSLLRWILFGIIGGNKTKAKAYAKIINHLFSQRGAYFA